MFIRVEETPNPDTLKFVPEEKFDVESTTLFNNIEKCQNAPFIKDLLSMDEVETVLLDKDFISVTKNNEGSWEVLKAIISSKITEFVESKKPMVINQKKENDLSKDNKSNEEDSPMANKIKELLNDKVKPVVASHGGDITFHSYKEGTVFLELKGSCSGCPSSTATLKMGIENMLKHYLPEVKEVLDVAQT